MRVRWEIEDGYVGKRRTHYVEIPDDELKDCETEEERDEVIRDYVQNDFDNRCSFVWEIVEQWITP